MAEAFSAEQLGQVITTPEFAAAVGACFMHSENRRLEGGFVIRLEDGAAALGQVHLPRSDSDNGGHRPANHVYFPDMDGSAGRFHSHPHHRNIGTCNSAMPSFGDLKSLLRHPAYPPWYIHGVIGRYYGDQTLGPTTRGVINLFRPDTYSERPHYEPQFAWILNVQAAPRNKVPDALRLWGISHASLGFHIEGEAAIIESDKPGAIDKAIETLFAI
jgi:hypothetical protein